MSKGYWISVLQAAIKTACVSATGVITISITNIIIQGVLEKQKNPIGFISFKKEK